MDIQKINSPAENHSPQERGLEDTRMQEMRDQIELLLEQVESLKQELSYEYQRTDEYVQELAHANQELEWMNQEITNLIASNILPLDEAKEFAKNLVENKKSLTESVSELTNTSDSSSVQVKKFERVDVLSSKPMFEILRTHGDVIRAKSQKLQGDSRQIANQNYELIARSRELRVNSRETVGRVREARELAASTNASPDALQHKKSNKAIASFSWQSPRVVFG